MVTNGSSRRSRRPLASSSRTLVRQRAAPAPRRAWKTRAAGRTCAARSRSPCPGRRSCRAPRRRGRWAARLLRGLRDELDGHHLPGLGAPGVRRRHEDVLRDAAVLRHEEQHAVLAVQAADDAAVGALEHLDDAARRAGRAGRCRSRAPARGRRAAPGASRRRKGTRAGSPSSGTRKPWPSGWPSMRPATAMRFDTWRRRGSDTRPDSPARRARRESAGARARRAVARSSSRVSGARRARARRISLRGRGRVAAESCL